MLHWILARTVGWQVFGGVAVAFAVAAAWLERRGRTGWVPYAFLVVWAFGMIAGYVNQQVDRYRTIKPALWIAMCVTLFVLMLIPLAAVQLGAWAAGHTSMRRRKWWVGALLGIVLIPLTNITSGVIGDFVLPRVLR